MKKRFKYLGYYSAFLILAFALIQCSGDTGPTGPAGPAGQQGIQGEQGEKGEEGNANVLVFEKDISGATWTTVGSNTNGYQQLDIEAPGVVTSDLLINRINLIYVNTSDAGGGNWTLLPYYTERNIRVNGFLAYGKIILTRSQDGEPSTQSWHRKVRLVSIEPSSIGVLSKARADDLPDFSDYYALMEYFALTE